jgi:hypothetical protein
LLVFLHALALQPLKKPAFGFLIKRLHQGEALARGLLFVLFLVAPEGQHTLAGHDFKMALLARCPGKTAIDAHRERAVR